MNNLLLILGLLALSNGDIPLFGKKDKGESEKKSLIDKEESFKENRKVPRVKTSTKIHSSESPTRKTKGKNRKIKKIKKIKKSTKSKVPAKSTINYNFDDVKNGMKLMELSEEDLDRGMEIITRTKKYMSKDERMVLIKLESILDLVKGIKKLSDVEVLGEEDESEFFRTMDDEDKKNMMIKEILEVFPEKKRASVEKAISMKKKIDILAELFLPDSEDGGGFSLGSLLDINNLGSSSNIKLLGSLLRGDSLDDDDDEEESDEDGEYTYVEYDKYGYVKDEGDAEN